MSSSTGHGGAKVSICVPAYQAGDHLAATIESVLGQTFTDWELIVVDNASTDQTFTIASSFRDSRIRVVQNPSVIPAVENWNKAAAQASAPLIKVLCADDVLRPDCLVREVAALDGEPEAVLVASKRDFITESGEIVLEGRGLRGLVGRHQASEVIDQVIRSGINPIGWPSALMFRRAAFEAVGGFDDRWLHTTDLHLWLRLLGHGSFVGLDETLAAYRISPGSISSRVGHRGSEHRRMLRTFVAESGWTSGRLSVLVGSARSRFEEIKRWLLFGSVNQRWGVLRRVPHLFVHGPRASTRSGSGSVVSWASAMDRYPVDSKLLSGNKLEEQRPA